ncbi:hypothetical protein [Amycolatopsis sp. NPDC051128]|uniref:hypothetical protein n=1 Tax=Amycolatopsis sp. NPDC051128 TaxID=3155412 RepID=UPI00344925B0
MTSPDAPPARGSAHLAAVLRERVYGGITCLSTLLVLAGRLREPLVPWAAVLDLVIATGGIWAASLFAEYVSHLALHDVDGERVDLRSLLRASGQILEAAVLPGLVLVAGALGGIPFSVAVWTSVWLLVAEMGLFALLAVRRTRLPWWKQLLLVVALVALGLGVILLKMA